MLSLVDFITIMCGFGFRYTQPLELFVQAFNRIRRPRAPPLARRQPCEGEQAIAGLLKTVGDNSMLEPPFAD
jgi:hypothetical protein